MERKICSRCNKPMNIWHDEEDGHPYWTCDLNLTQKEFDNYWNKLPKEERDQLTTNKDKS